MELDGLREKLISREKSCDVNPCCSCKLLAAAAGVSKSSMHRVLRNNLGRKPFKILHHHELTDHHVSMRAQKCRKILKDINEGTLPNLVFTDKKKFDIQHVVNQQNNQIWVSLSSTKGRIITRHQNPLSVMVCAAVMETRRSPFLFVPSGVKLSSQQYITDILEGCLLP